MVRVRDRLHVGKGSKARQEIVGERFDLSSRGLLAGYPDLKSQDIRGAIARIDTRELEEASHYQSAADEEHGGHTDFRNDEQSLSAETPRHRE